MKHVLMIVFGICALTAWYGIFASLIIVATHAMLDTGVPDVIRIVSTIGLMIAGMWLIGNDLILGVWQYREQLEGNRYE
jgi:hypothetical protein